MSPIQSPMLARKIAQQALDSGQSTLGFEMRANSHGFDVLRRGKTEIVALISNEGLLLTARSNPEEVEAAADVNGAWDFIEKHLRSLVPRAYFEGEAELLQKMTAS